ncbi:MAG TPA: TlpA disulfide reductase family protein [Burkholderiales bacterium]|nr:TlpA disulfide reductase family protein [Burkholderiales bacterium]
MKNDKRRFLLFAAVAIVAAMAGVLFHFWRLDSGGVEQGVEEAVMATQLADLQGQTQPLNQWRGKVLVVNFWATWCAPCREEIPVFVRLQDKYRAQGLQFIGIAIDQREPVQVFAKEFGMNYPVLLGGIESVEMSRRAGNRVGALPFTLIIDRNGKIVGSALGGIKEAKLQELVRPLL